MKLLLLLASCLSALALAGCSDESGAAVDAEQDGGFSDEAKSRLLDQGWELVWADEFDGSELDRTKWTPEISCWGGGNNERQCYTDRAANLAVENGVLRLKARKETFTGPDRPPEIAFDPNPQTTQPYTSGKVRTRGLHAWKYGRIEARARVPAGQGTWSAIWMLPEDNVYGGWPLSGEIDIVEAINLGASCEDCDGAAGENRTISALHFGDTFPDNTYVSKGSALPDRQMPSDAFQIYSVEWGEGLIRFLVNDREHFRATQDDWFTSAENAKGRAAAPFDQPFYVMMNLAVGGRLSEENNDKVFDENSFPSELVVDWVRVYHCSDDPGTGLACIK